MSEYIIVTDLGDLRPGDLIQHAVLDGVLVSRGWLAQHAAEVREQVAKEIEWHASDVSYTHPAEITEAYLDAARIAREGGKS